MSPPETTTLSQPDSISVQPAPTSAQPDSQMQAVLETLNALGGRPIETLSPTEARLQPTPADAVRALRLQRGEVTPPAHAVTISDIIIAGASAPLRARVYTPVAGVGPFPLVVYYHGGGWVIADLDTYDAGPRALAAAAQAIVISVHYRQAPEHSFPAAHDDAFDAYEWTLANAVALDGNPSLVALAGESAGGGLAVATALTARDNALQMPLAVIAIYPIAGTDTRTASYVEHAEAQPLNAAMMAWFFDQYLPDPIDRADPRVNLVSANLAGLPPVTLINAAIDPLRSEGELLHNRLQAAGVATTQHTFPGVTHEFFGMAAVVDKAVEANRMAADALRSAFGSS